MNPVHLVQITPCELGKTHFLSHSLLRELDYLSQKACELDNPDHDSGDVT
jgi:hypothetical protein